MFTVHALAVTTFKENKYCILQLIYILSTMIHTCHACSVVTRGHMQMQMNGLVLCTLIPGSVFGGHISRKSNYTFA
jgi:hypothetical protein